MAPHLRDRESKASRALGATMQIWARYPYMTTQFKMQLADTLFGSVLKYASEVWAWGNVDIIDRAEAKMLRRACGVGPKVSGTAVRWLLGRVPVVAKCWCQAYKFWGTIVEMGSERFENAALQTSWVMHRELGRGWVHDMISVFVRIGFSPSMEESLTMQAWAASDIKSG